MTILKAKEILNAIAHDAKESSDYEGSAATILKQNGFRDDSAEAIASILAWNDDASLANRAKFLAGHESEIWSFLMNVDAGVREELTSNLIGALMRDARN